MSSSLLVVGALAQSAEMQQVLQQHNVFRCMHGLPALTWDSAIATSAQAWADGGNYAHSPSDQRVINDEQCGENLAWGFPSLSGHVASKDWYAEIQYTSPYGTADSMSDSTPSGKAIGHYTQQVWAGTSRLGCGKGKATVSSNEGDFWVCQYGKAGNYQDQFQQNVPAPIKGPQECGGSTSDVPSNFPSSLHSRPASGSGGSGGAGGSGTVAPPGGYTGGLGKGAGQQFDSRIISGTVSLSDVDGAAFCKSEVALEAVEKGIANVAKVPADYVRAWCGQATSRRLQSGNQAVLRYTIQIPTGTDPNASAASIENQRQALEDSINDQLRQSGAPHRVVVSFAVARVSGSASSSESMPGQGGAVSSANMAAAQNSFSGLFQLPALALPEAPHAAVVGLLAVVLLVAGGVLTARRQRQWRSAAEPVQNAME